MKTAIIVHGTADHEEYFDESVPSSSNHHWIPWLQKQLIVRGIHAHTPEIPSAWKPHYPFWQSEFERYAVNEETILVGHSCGGGFLTRWLSQHPQVKVGKVVLVAPWLDPDRRKTTDFFDFEIDPNIAARTNGLTIFHSDNDMKEVADTVQRLRNVLKGIDYREFHHYGHFCLVDMKTPAFPELLESALTNG